MPGIVVGVDGSHHSTRALEWAVDEAALRQAPLTVLAVHPVAADIFGLAPQIYPADEEARAKVEQATQELVDGVLSGRRGQAPAVTVRAVNGIPADELIQASAAADLLVVGARGSGGFGRLLMGSVSTQVSQHALCPVAIVPKDRNG
jgi:nucleotide-binding universal stress UspA family protein